MSHHLPIKSAFELQQEETALNQQLEAAAQCGDIARVREIQARLVEIPLDRLRFVIAEKSQRVTECDNRAAYAMSLVDEAMEHAKATEREFLAAQEAHFAAVQKLQQTQATLAVNQNQSVRLSGDIAMVRNQLAKATLAAVTE